MLSNTSKYAIRAVIYLAIYAVEKKRIGIKKIADDLNIPSPFLGKILQVLVRRKLLSSTKGPNGGFGLGKEPEKITLYDIIIEMDGDDLFNTCLLGTRNCDDEKKEGEYCALHNDFEDVRNKMVELYKNKTIGELAANAEADLGKVIL